INGHKKVVHLCQSCAIKQQLIKQPGPDNSSGESVQFDLNLPAILQTLLGQHVGPLNDELSRLTCPACGIKYMEFRAEGRLGCPHDYEVFRGGLAPLIQRIHRAEKHVGKTPRHRLSSPAMQAELVALRRRLRLAVEAEAYEEAAQIRDLLRTKEATDESG